MEQQGSPLTYWLIRTSSQTSRGTFAQEPLATSALHHRVQKYLKAMGNWQGETVHSLRRGSTQGAKESGLTDAEIARQRLWASEESVRLYGHPTRHLRRLRSVAGTPDGEEGQNSASGSGPHRSSSRA